MSDVPRLVQEAILSKGSSFSGSIHAMAFGRPDPKSFWLDDARWTRVFPF